MSSGMSYIGSSLIKLAIILIAVVILAIYLPPLFQVTPTVEVTNCALASDSIPNNGQTSLSFDLKNNDASNAHTITVQFSSHELVTFMLGSQYLPEQNNIWQYTDNLNPSSTHAQSINVKASLENGIAKLDYRINVTFYMDGKQFESKSLDLTVRR